MAIIGNTKEGIINVNHKAIIEIHFKVITKRSAIFIRSQIANFIYLNSGRLYFKKLLLLTQQRLI